MFVYDVFCVLPSLVKLLHPDVEGRLAEFLAPLVELFWSVSFKASLSAKDIGIWYTFYILAFDEDEGSNYVDLFVISAFKTELYYLGGQPEFDCPVNWDNTELTVFSLSFWEGFIFLRGKPFFNDAIWL